MKPNEIRQRLEIQKTNRAVIEPMWDDIEKFIMPLRLGQMFNDAQNGELSQDWEREEIYDTTGVFSAQTMASAMHGSITNPVVKWFEFLFQAKELRQDPESVEWLQQCTERVYAELYDNNFDSEISSAFQDLVGPGNAIMMAEPENENPDDWQGTNFSCVPLKEFYFEQDHRGRLAIFYWVRNWTVLQIREKFPAVTLPKVVQESLDANKFDVRHNVIFCIWRRHDKRKNENKYPLAPLNRPFGYGYVLEGDDNFIGEESGYYEMPAYLTRFEKTSGSQWGFGPGAIMAPTCKFINAWMELEQTAVRKMIDPTTLAEERALIGDLNLGPGKLTLVRNINGIKAYQSEGRIDFSKMELKELRDMVRAAFKVDELQLKESPQMSATEAQIRYELMNRVLGPTLARLQTDLLDPLLLRIFRMLLRNKQFPAVPRKVKALKGQLKIDYQGPLMRAQKSDETAAIERFVGQVGAMAKVFPTIMNLIDPVKVGRELATRLGVPGDILRSDAEVERATRVQQKLAAMQAKAALQQQQGDAKQSQAQADQMNNPQQGAA
jgi:hypothetical protein